MNYIKINRKVSAGVYEAYYCPSDVKTITSTTAGAGATRTTEIAIATISGVTHTLELTQGIEAADDQTVIDYFWAKVLEANSKGSDFAGIASTMGSNFKQGLAGGAAILSLIISGGTNPILITIDSDTVS